MTPEASTDKPKKVRLDSFLAITDMLAPVSSSMVVWCPQTLTVSLYGGTDDGTTPTCHMSKADESSDTTWSPAMEALVPAVVRRHSIHL